MPYLWGTNGAEKLQDVALEPDDLDSTIQDLARSTVDDVDGDFDIQHGASSASGTALDSNDNDLELADIEIPIDDDFLIMLLMINEHWIMIHELQFVIQ